MGRLLLISVVLILLSVMVKHHLCENGNYRPIFCDAVQNFSSVFINYKNLSHVFRPFDSTIIRNCTQPQNYTIISIGYFNNVSKRTMYKGKYVDVSEADESHLNFIDNSFNDNLTEFKKQYFYRGFSLQSNLKGLAIYHDDLTSNMLINILKINSYIEHLHIYATMRENFTTPITLFDNLLKLQTIHIENSGFNKIPGNLFDKLSRLNYLSLEDNNIESLPNVLCQFCSELASLFLQGNKITTLNTKVFHNLINLKILNLSNNRIRFMPCGIFKDLVSLKTLSMNGNNLQILGECHVRHLTNLREALFSFNNLTLQDETTNSHSPVSPFRNNLKIELLYLTNNQISTIFDDWLKFEQLHYLNISNNNIEYLKEKHFHFKSTCDMKLDVSHNKIKTMSILDDTKKLNYSLGNTKVIGKQDTHTVTISVNNNPIICDCNLYSMLLNLEKKIGIIGNREFIIRIGTMQCNEPKWLNNIPIATLKSETLKCSVERKNALNATCPDPCKCWRIPSDSMYIVDCFSRGLTVAPKIIIPPAEYQINLNLSNNSLSRMPLMSQPGYDSVTILDLSHNNIDYLPEEALSMNLKILHIHHNKLSKIDYKVLTYIEKSKNFSEITIYDNLWACNCQTFKLVRFIRRVKLKLFHVRREIFCKERKLQLWDISENELCPSINGWIVGVCVGLSSLTVILVVTYHRYKQEIKVWLYAKQWCLWWVTEDELDRDKLYDAFISFSHKDNDFVTNELVSKLESGPQPLKLCIHYRDWLAGEYISTQVVHSVQNSRRTIVVLSKNFLESIWGKIEFRTAHCQALNDGRIRVIVIIFGDLPAVESLDVELQSYLNMNTYVKWGDPWFWHKLRYALPHCKGNIVPNIDA